jgi:Zn-dependent peptidase ImmA (M78 family)/transcriptional regulator with XRE-family HTH domain
MLERGTNVARGGFVAARLILARAARGIKQKDLADKIGRSPAALSKWENPEQGHQPNDSDVEQLSSILNVTPLWFFKSADTKPSASFFRSLRSELKIERDKTAAKLVFAHEIFQAASEQIEFPSVDIPVLPDVEDYRLLSMSEIDRIADQVRAYWGLGDGPIDDLMTVIENAGIIVADDFLVSEKLDGVSRWFDERPVMLLAKDKETGVRRRFDAAHELGHIILHRNVGIDDLNNDWRLIEDQAMAFAASFLMPTSSFAHSVSETSLDALANLKPIWKVSIAAMLMRLKSLNLIDSDESKSLWKYYSYRRWRGNEPHDDQVSFEKPINLASAVEMIAEGGPRELEAFLYDAAISKNDIISLTGAKEKFFIRLQSQKPRLKLVRNVDAAKAAND